MTQVNCPVCNGVLDDECTECFGRGYIEERRKVGDRTAKDAEYYGYDLPGEIWKPYPEWGVYHISNYGRALNTETGRLRKITLTKQHAPLVTVDHPVQGKLGMAFHRVVAILFMPDFDPKLQVVWKDGDPLNNHVDNLTQTKRVVRGKGRAQA